ncbi:MAG TPA: FAD-binding oxidoreductase [Acetobacteraceae bacterium]|jgi:glycine/D-amino acid oxidase-like deaminating enzyme|nr:FAD-binding oxidoreductase [Acetobacteraceae bacterium]
MIHDNHAHVVIVGGGAVGSSIAYHLAVRPDFRGRITVVERDPTYARASSALSASSIRQQFSTPVNIRLSQFGIQFLRELGLELGLREGGYLFLASAEGAETLRANHALQRSMGADLAFMQPSALIECFPWLNADGIAAGVLGLSGEGWFDGPALMQAFRRKARELGATYLTGEAIKVRPGRVWLTDRAIDADVVVIAAGAWTGRLLDLPIRPRRRMVFVVACPTVLPGCPLLIDPSGVWMRPEGSRFLCGRSPAGDEPDPDEPPLAVDEALFMESVWPVLAHRIPAMETLKLTSSWAGYYEMNLFDHNGAVGPLPGLDGVLVAAGFSGHGIQHSPGVGRGIAELIVDGRYTTLDLSPLDPGRIARGERLVERNVV